jgi:ATP-dependent NAD(P)H-hydrate dehydratase
VVEVLKEARTRCVPFVLDADALLLVQEQPDLVRGYADCILTPNVVEFRRLARAVGVDVQLSIGAEERERENMTSASDACERLSSALGGVTIIQKGRHDVISNGMVTLLSDMEGGLKRSGGQGDTLTGALGTFLAWRKAYHEGLWDTGVDSGKIAQAKHDIESEINDASSFRGKKMSPTTTILLAAWAGSIITRECSRRAFAAKGRSMQASDLTEEVHGSFSELIGEPGVSRL